MTIDWVHFTPWTALAGGAVLGLAAGLFALLNGRIAGISGLLAALFNPNDEARAEKLLFVAGLLATPFIWQLFRALPEVRFEGNAYTLALAGLIVGIGTRYGAGCTSGHGVCGLSRLSARSLVATLAFMAAGFATVFTIRHLLGS